MYIHWLISLITGYSAFDNINRNCLWFKMMKLGIKGRILDAIHNLYSDVKQGCKLFPTLFSTYVNALAKKSNNLKCGVQFDVHVISISIVC